MKFKHHIGQKGRIYNLEKDVSPIQINELSASRFRLLWGSGTAGDQARVLRVRNL